MTDIALSFRNADGALRSELTGCLDFMNATPFFQRYKQETWDALQISGNSKILDVACGVGFDVIGLARRFPRVDVFGLDSAHGFLGLARERAQGIPNALFVAGDSRSLPFGDRQFDGVRIDRSLQHIPAPIEALREMVRVTRKGGRIVVAEPDWGTYFVYNGRLETGAKMAELWEKSFANPYIGREIGVLLQKCGVENIDCRAHALTVGSLDAAEIIFDLTRVTENCVSAGVLTRDEAEDWSSASKAASRNGAFLACLNIMLWEASIPD
ncbi:methyltransferase domain-containing protein [Methylocystis sp. SC2]|uniref:methyltransferase domain-containing protein n=1 Tax=Methylocystis sp. (strain SC2) TaxID=187303 RepID=UPI00027AE777|nr:methyltransferase domain-containing protein [Methylocystis sp. SC2]CCJ07901.1 Methyltransferase type 11 [Methylocystis sp. SC2]